LLHQTLGNLEKAREMAQKDVDISEIIFGVNHHVTARTYNNMAGILSNSKEYNQALEYALRAFKVWRSTLGLQHPNVQSAFTNLGSIYTKIGHTREEFYQWVAQNGLLPQ
jgi:tetratricopeptide (TPR) repeat protein